MLKYHLLKIIIDKISNFKLIITKNQVELIRRKILFKNHLDVQKYYERLGGPRREEFRSSRNCKKNSEV